MVQPIGANLTTSYVDLRSDTVTRPTAAMRRAMADAEVGDDVFEDDPTVRLLEQETAAILGKEAALFVPSGCMGNETAVAVSTRRGDAILLDRNSHLVYHESAAVTELLGRRYRFVLGDRGRLAPEQVTRALVGPEPLGLVSLEQTHNWGNGAIYPLPRLRAVREAARAIGLPVHLDGARLWNASAATGIAPSEYAACADTVMVCYSKALGAPIGSAVAGTAAMIREAREVRSMFGGAMRQVGIIAAAALHALRHHRDRLPEDHARARRLAAAIAEIPGVHLDPAQVESNIVIAELEDGVARLPRFLSSLEAQGVLVVDFGGPGRFRAVTHLDVDDAGIDRAIAAIRVAAGAVAAR
jgi:threonine aldolase